MEVQKFRKNNLGLLGWLSGGRFGFERYAYTLHRVTGLGLFLYFIIHIFATATRLSGEAAWEAEMALFRTPIFKIGEYLVFVAFAIHAMNGIRLVITELALGLGKPVRPIYPYRVSIHRQRPLLVWVMILAAIIIVAGGYDFFLAH